MRCLMDQTDTTTHQAPSEGPRTQPVQRGSAQGALRLRPGGPTWEPSGGPLASPDGHGGDVLVAIECAGLCRTDLQVASGELPAAAGVTLGHEASGRVLRGVADLPAGARVAFDPWIPCGACAGCRTRTGARPKGRAARACHRPQRLGIERDGVFASLVSVPPSNLYRVSDSVAPERAAYLEPVAAAMGAMRAPIDSRSRVLVYGDNRIASLTERLLKARTDAEIQSLPGDAGLPECLFDVAIETGLAEHTIGALTRALVPGGTLVLKSRGSSAASLIPGDLVAKDITIFAPAYGSFQAAADLVSDPTFPLEDLFGETLAFTDFARAFELAHLSESAKVFLGPG